MDPVLKRYAAMAVPRYTSYPTAPHFRADFPAATAQDWLARIDPEEPVSLYVHVPFCRKLCWYCGCNMKLVSRYEPVTDYMTTVLAEIDMVAAMVPGRLKVAHLHLGGGTPTALSEDDLARLTDALRARFDILPDAELAIECDPRTMTPEMAARIGALGYNRASFGIQEFDEKVQKAINRIQPLEMVARTVSDLRAAGVSAINFDLIYGLPYQTVDSLTRTIHQCTWLQPDRFALFGYAHVPWMAKKQRMIPEEALPGAEDRFAQATAAAGALSADGYRPIGIDHFAQPHDPLARAAEEGTLQRNFQGYTTDTARTLIPLGPTSIGRTPFGFTQNITETGAWSRAVHAGHLPVAKGLALSADDSLRAWVIERLMCDFSVDLKEASDLFDPQLHWADRALEQLAPMVADGLATVENGIVSMTRKGRPVVRVAAAAFDAWRETAPARHSVAV